MIYLIKSAGFDENENYITLLKIGFTDNQDKRFNSYSTHNPTYKLLRTIDGGTEEHEKALHQRFKHLQYKNEWFKYDEEIINYFENLSYDLLDNLLKISKPEGCFKKVSKDLRDRIKKSLPDELKYLADDFYRKSDISLDDNLRQFYYSNRLWEKNIDPMEFGLDNFQEDFKDLLSDYYSLRGNISERLKFICEVDPNLVSIFLQQLNNDDYAKSYYLQLGPGRCKALGYNITKIRKELGIIKFDKQFLEKEIHLIFSSGQRITKADAKTMLSTLYQKIGYSRTPKANDLSEWFDLRDIVISQAGKKVHGFELLKKK